MTQRIYSLDVLRGVAIMIMIFVDVPPGVAYPIFIHAPWEGLTFADFAFPGFVFAMGMSAAVSMAKREPSTKKILKRTILLFALGILFNTIPFILALLIRSDFTAAIFFERAIENIRVFGILQRLALTYALGIFIARLIRNDIKIFIAAFVLLIAYSAGFHLYAPDNPFAQEHNISGAVDCVFPGVNHIYQPTHDPEGVYGTFASTASFLFGFTAGKILLDTAAIRDKIFLLTATGGALMIIGGAWNFVDIIAKKLWTAPFALITSAVEIFLLVALIILLENFPRTKKFLQPFCAAGTNPLLLFFLVAIVFLLLNTLSSPDAGTNLYVWFFNHTFRNLISPEFGSMIFCAIFCALWLSFAKFLHGRGIVIKL